MFKKYFLLSIPLKFSLFVASLVILTMAVNTYFVVSYNNKVIRKSMESRARSIATSLSFTGAKVVIDNLYLIQGSLAGFSTLPDVSAISFIDDDNMITASGDISKIGEDLSADELYQGALRQKKETITYYKNRRGSEMLVIFEPMREGEKIQGWIRLDLSLKETRENTRKQSVGLVFLAIFLTGSAIFLTFWISRKISFVLDLLVTKFKKLAGGDFTEKLQIRTGDELEKVASSYNILVEKMSSMVHQLEQKRKKTEKALFNSQESLAHAQRIAHLGNWDFDLIKNELILSEEIYRIFGLKIPARSRETYEKFLSSVHPGDREFLKKSVFESSFEGKPFDLDHRIILPDGSERMVHEQAEVFYDEGGTPVRMIGTVQDITDRKKAEDRLHFLAYYNPLTSLPNRTLFHYLLEKAISKAQKTGEPLSVVIIDLNRFKEINATLGHHRGDLLLKQVGGRLKGFLEPSETLLAHMGGDEFSLLLSMNSSGQQGQAEQASQVVTKILEVLKMPFEIEGLPIALEMGIGISFYPDHGNTPDTLIQKADVAMYESKKNGTDYTFYDPKQDQHSPGRLGLMGELREGIEKGELFLLYQPKIDLKNGKICGTEGLVRWKHPKQGVIFPDQFILPAEQTGLIKQITAWVLKTGLIQCRSWQKAGFPLRMAINLSARNLQDLLLPYQIDALLQSCGVAPELLDLEITETAIMTNEENAIRNITSISKKGIGISIDDFGIGYSSLRYLKKLPISSIKIDKSFVKDMMTNEEDFLIVRSTIDLAHNFGLKVIAEGVENRTTLEKLIDMGCDEAQGYYISRPVPPEQIKRLLEEKSYETSLFQESFDFKKL